MPPARPFLAVRDARAVALAATLAPFALAAQSGPPAGAAVTRIVVDSVELVGVTTLGELLQARAPGLLVSPTSGLAGSGARLTARGRQAVYSADEPLLVVDGVRVIGGRRAALVDSSFVVSRFDDLPVEQVAAVDVLPGPAAAARYGPGAAAGAVVVTTRRGVAGRAERRFYADGGTGAPRSEGPTFYRGVGRFDDGIERAGCSVDVQVRGDCTLARVEAVRPYDAAGWRTAARARAGARLSGGSARARYLVGADGARLGGPVAGSDVVRGSLRASADLRIAPTFRVALAGTASTQATDAPFGALASRVDLGVNRAFGTVGTGTRVADAALHARRIDASATADWDARPWLTTRAAVSTSGTRQRERSYRETLGTGSTGPVSHRGVGTARDRVSVAEVGATASYRVAGAAFATALTGQRIGEDTRTGLEIESRFPGSAPPFDHPRTSTQGSRRRQQATVHGLVLSHEAAAGRLTAAGTFRLDRVGDAGANAPSGAANVAYRAWRRGAHALDLRAAAGSAVADAGAPLVREFIPLPTSPYVFLGGVPPTRPPRFERTREVEAGVDATLGPALTARATVYQQRTRDMLVDGPPQLTASGFGPGAPSSMGLRIRGAEASVTGRLVERPGLGVTLGLRAWAGRTRVVDVRMPRVILVPGEASNRLRDGDPLGAFVSVFGSNPVRDTDGDGRLSNAEVGGAIDAVLRSGRARYDVVGVPTPTRAAAAELRARVGARVTVAALLEHQGGHRAEGDLPAMMNAARASNDPTTPVAEQAYAAAARWLPELRLERADFARLREVAVGWRVRGGTGRGPSTVVTLAGRNLLTLGGHSGLDPETALASGSALTGASDWAARYGVPVARTLALRVATAW